MTRGSGTPAIQRFAEAAVPSPALHCTVTGKTADPRNPGPSTIGQGLADGCTHPAHSPRPHRPRPHSLHPADDLLEEVPRLVLHQPPLLHNVVKQLAGLRGEEGTEDK